MQTRHHEVAASAGFNCTSCHAGIVDQSNCLNCHDRSNNGVRDQHHAKASADNIACAQCHTDINQVTNCQSCHKAGSKQQAHHDAAKTRQIECSSCHTSFPAGTAGEGCVQCHQGGDNRVFHHGTVATNNSFDCSSCHGVAVLNQLDNCRDCHAQGEKAVTHHDAAAAQNINCSTCHTAFPAGTAGDGCVNCHQAGNNQAFHHDTVAKDPVRNLSCSDCHSGIDTTASSCASCHDFAAANPHHNNPNVDAFGLNCNSCHVWGFNEWGAYAMLMPTPDDCVSCHTNVVASGVSIPEVHHATQPALDGLCTSCHAGVQTGLNCSDCHSSNGGTVSDRHHTGVAVDQNLGCSDCHGTTAEIYSVDTQCESCHVAKDGPIADRHHGTQNYLNDNCTVCHTAVPAALGCSDCHGAGGATTAETHHSSVATQPDGTVLDCTYCHTGADTVFASCESCHTSGTFDLFPNPVSVPDLHHMTTPAQTDLCGTCHTGTTEASLQDCITCHVQNASVPIKDRHHDTTDPGSSYNLGQCSACHTGADPAAIACLNCHADSPGSPDKHHGQPELVGSNPVWDCSQCHGGIQVNGNGCSACHTAPITAIHHEGPDSPLVQVGGDCSVCHQSVSSPNVCANCHQSSPHHTTQWAQSGDCAHCHKVPESAQDRPMQAACRECHGPNQHGKGGPIQDYGACAACHNQDTFHAAPGGPVGYTRSAPGKGKFAIFWNQYTNGGDEEVRENVSPNGEDMDDEGGRKWRNPTLNFTMKQIQHNGRNYNVPAFPNLPGTSRPAGNIAGGSSTSTGGTNTGGTTTGGNSHPFGWTNPNSSHRSYVKSNGTSQCTSCHSTSYSNRNDSMSCYKCHGSEVVPETVCRNDLS